jgi:hypothetical protein
MNKLMVRLAAAIACVATSAANAAIPATAPTAAADAYALAAAAITSDSPASSNMTYPNYPPFGEDWDYLAKQSWEENAPARELARQARALNEAHWPTGTGSNYLNPLRNLANIVGDAALYAQLNLGQHADSVECIRDLVHLAELLRNQPKEQGALVRMLVADGIDALAMDRLLIIASGVELTPDSSDAVDLQVDTARQLISELLKQRDPAAEVGDIIAVETKGKRPGVGPDKVSWDRVLEVAKRTDSERTLAAMSLACHLYQLKNQHWPNSLADLVPEYLPSAPVDPWGNGHQMFGYVLIKSGLTNGADRPLVYCRCNGRDGLFFRTDAPQYGFYVGDGSDQPTRNQKQGGEFRDVVRWSPPAEKPAGPTTQPIAAHPSIIPRQFDNTRQFRHNCSSHGLVRRDRADR